MILPTLGPAPPLHHWTTSYKVGDVRYWRDVDEYDEQVHAVVLAGALHEWAPPRPPHDTADITSAGWLPEDYDALGVLHAAELGLELVDGDDDGVDYPEDQWH